MRIYVFGKKVKQFTTVQHECQTCIKHEFQASALLTSITIHFGPMSPCHRDGSDCARGVLRLWYRSRFPLLSSSLRPYTMGIFKLAFCLSERKNGEVTLDYVAGKPLKASIHAVNKRHECGNLFYWPPARMRNWLSPFLSAWHPQDMWCMGMAVFGRKMWTCSSRRFAFGSSSTIRQPTEQT